MRLIGLISDYLATGLLIVGLALPGVGADSYEPDDSFGAAQTIAAGETQTRTIHAADDSDYLTFTIAALSAVVIETSGVSGAGDTVLTLYDGGEVELARDDQGGLWNFSRIEMPALAAGTYFVKVEDWLLDGTVTSYDITFTATALSGPGELSLSASTYTVVEGDAGTTSAVITVTRSGGADGAVDVEYYTQARTSDAAATENIDYTHVIDTLTWADGDIAPKTFVVPIIGDSELEHQEELNVRIRRAGGGAALGDQRRSTLFITDNDSLDAYEVDDDFASAALIATGDSQVRSIHAAGNLDHATFTLAEWSAVTIETAGPIGDTVLSLYDSSEALLQTDDDGGDTFFSRISEPALPPGTYLVKVEDWLSQAVIPYYTLDLTTTALAGVGELTFTDVSYEFSETDGTTTALISVARTGGVSGAASVDFATSDGSATTGNNDYTAATGTLSWADNDATVQNISITINGDTTFEPNEDLTITLSNATGGATIGTSEATLTILNDDGDTYEVDDDFASASSLPTAVSQQRNIHTAGNKDYAAFELFEEAHVIIETAGEAGDTVLYLYDENQVLVTFDDHAGVDDFSRIKAKNLTAGIYYVVVEEYLNDGTIDAYTLSMDVTFVAPRRSIGFRIVDHSGSGIEGIQITRGTLPGIPDEVLETRLDGFSDDNGIDDPGDEDDPLPFPEANHQLDQTFEFVEPLDGAG